MTVGDTVKLKDIPQNNQRFLSKYQSKTGKIVDEQTMINKKRYFRVLFDDASSYEDLGSWRFEIFLTP
jgi:hypothetical protein